MSGTATEIEKAHMARLAQLDAEKSVAIREFKQALSNYVDKNEKGTKAYPCLIQAVLASVVAVGVVLLML